MRKIQSKLKRSSSTFIFYIGPIAAPNSNSSVIADIDYNERFIWRGVHEMSERYQDALVRGLPFPILTVAEYFSLGVEGFRWGGEYRAAGYYSDKLLW